MTDFEKKKEEAAEKYAHKRADGEFLRFFYVAIFTDGVDFGAEYYKKKAEKLVEALKLICENKCAEQNPCAAKEALLEYYENDEAFLSIRFLNADLTGWSKK